MHHCPRLRALAAVALGALALPLNAARIQAVAGDQIMNNFADQSVTSVDREAGVPGVLGAGSYATIQGGIPKLGIHAEADKLPDKLANAVGITPTVPANASAVITLSSQVNYTGQLWFNFSFSESSDVSVDPTPELPFPAATATTAVNASVIAIRGANVSSANSHSTLQHQAACLPETGCFTYYSEVTGLFQPVATAGQKVLNTEDHLDVDNDFHLPVTLSGLSTVNIQLDEECAAQATLNASASCDSSHTLELVSITFAPDSPTVDGLSMNFDHGPSMLVGTAELLAGSFL
jgi:hypothetical protein